MTNIFFISDTHFGHKGVVEFLRGDSTKLRPFATTEEMDEVLVANWNAVVRPSDLVYHLGDVVINRRCLPTIGRLNGRKKLIKGNHDTFRLKEYAEYFEDIYGVLPMEGMILSHIPLHPDSVHPRFGVNVHGHLHAEVINSPLYLNVSVEQINYTPISLEEVRSKVVKLSREKCFDKLTSVTQRIGFYE